MPVLRVTSGPHAGQRFSFPNGTFEIGRDPDAGLSLPNDNGVSRKHVRVEVSGTRVTIHDLGSRNGVFHNGNRTLSTIINAGDRIQVGGSVLELEQDPPPESSSAPMAAPDASPAPPASPPQGYGGAHPPIFMPPAGPGPGPIPPGFSGYPPQYAGTGAYSGAAQKVPYSGWLYFLVFSIPQFALIPAIGQPGAAMLWICLLTLPGLILGGLYLRRDTPVERHTGIWIIVWSLIGAALTVVSIFVLCIFAALGPVVKALSDSGMGGRSGLPGAEVSTLKSVTGQ